MSNEKIEFALSTNIIVTLREKDNKVSTHTGTNIVFDVSPNVDRRNFFDKEDNLNAEGIKGATQCCVQGLIGLIHLGHQNGLWDSAKHMRYIIDELERGFVAQAKVKIG